jgi:chromosome segregation ATPase
VQQHSRVAKLEEANTALRAELAATHTKVAEVEHCERALASDYGSLRNDFNDLQSAHTAIVKEKADLKKMKRDKVRRFATCCAKNWPGFAMIWRSR